MCALCLTDRGPKASIAGGREVVDLLSQLRSIVRVDEVEWGLAAARVKHFKPLRGLNLQTIRFDLTIWAINVRFTLGRIPADR